MKIAQIFDKMEAQGIVLDVSTDGDSLVLADSTKLSEVQVEFLREHRDELINHQWARRQQLLVEIKKVFSDLDLPWTNDDFDVLSSRELEDELEKARLLLDDEELMKDVEKVKNDRVNVLNPDDDLFKDAVEINGMIYAHARYYRIGDNKK